MTETKSDIEIARESNLKPIVEIGAALDIPEASLYQYGRYKAKIDYGFLKSIQDKPYGKLIRHGNFPDTGR